MQEFSYLCIGGPAHGQWYASPNPDRLRLAVVPSLQATFIETDLSEIAPGPMYSTFEYVSRRFTFLGMVKTLWTDPYDLDRDVLDQLKLYLLERFMTGEIR